MTRFCLILIIKIVSAVFEIFLKKEAKKKTLFSCMITYLYGKVKNCQDTKIWDQCSWILEYLLFALELKFNYFSSVKLNFKCNYLSSKSGLSNPRPSISMVLKLFKPRPKLEKFVHVAIQKNSIFFFIALF